MTNERTSATPTVVPTAKTLPTSTNMQRWVDAIEATHDPAERAELAAAVARWSMQGKFEPPVDPAVAMAEQMRAGGSFARSEEPAGDEPREPLVELIKSHFEAMHGRPPTATELAQLRGRASQRRRP